MPFALGRNLGLTVSAGLNHTAIDRTADVYRYRFDLPSPAPAELDSMLILFRGMDIEVLDLKFVEGLWGDEAEQEMRAYIDELNARLEHLRLQVDRAQRYAVLANLGGIEQ